MTTDDAAYALALYFERRGDYAAEVIWDAALVMLRHAIADVEGYGHWRSYPRGRLRKLRRGVVEAMELARLAVNIQDGINERDLEIARDAEEQHRTAAARRRREQTMPAELARLAKAAARRAELEDDAHIPRVNFHLSPEYRQLGQSPDS